MRSVLVRPDTSDVAVFCAVFARHVFDVPGLPDDPRLILDLGAYTGLSTRWFCDRFPDAKVVAVEPNPESWDLLRRNAPKASVLPIAVGDGRQVSVREGTREAWSSHTRDGLCGGTTAPSMTVDAILGGRRPDIVKMDIEGAERDAFDGQCEWLGHVRLLFLETHDRFLPGCLEAARRALDRTGRRYDLTTRHGSSCDHVVRFP